MLHFQVFLTTTEDDLRLLFTEGPAGHNISTHYHSLMQYLHTVFMEIGLILLL